MAASCVVMLDLIFALFVPEHLCAEGLPILGLSTRLRLSNQTTLGDPQRRGGILRISFKPRPEDVG